MKGKSILIYGASGHGKVIIDVVEKEGKNKIVGLIDDNSKIHRKVFCGYPIIGGFDNLKEEANNKHNLIFAHRRFWQRCRRRPPKFGWEP